MTYTNTFIFSQEIIDAAIGWKMIEERDGKYYMGLCEVITLESIMLPIETVCGPIEDTPTFTSKIPTYRELEYKYKRHTSS